MRVINNNTRSASVKSIISGALRSSKKSESILLSPNDEYDLIPTIKKIEQYTNESGVKDLYLTMQFYCLVDVDKFNNSDCKEIQMNLINKQANQIGIERSTSLISKVAINVSKEMFKNKTNTDKTDNLVQKNNVSNIFNQSKNSRNANQVIEKTAIISLLNNQAMYNLKKLVKPKVIDSIVTDENQVIEKFIAKFVDLGQGSNILGIQKKTKKKIKINESLKTRLDRQSLNTSNLLNLKLDRENVVFKKKHKDIIEKGIDPITLFVESTKNKKSFTDKRKGRMRYIDNSAKNMSNSNHSLIDLVGVFIQNNEEKFNKYTQITTETKNYIQIESESVVSLSELNKFGPSLNFIFYAKNNANINIESMTLTYPIDKITKQLNKSSKDYQISSLRKKDGISKLTIQNRSSNNLNLRLIYKKYTGFNSFLKNQYSQLDIPILKKNESVNYNSGYIASGTKKIKRDKIKNIENVLYRSLLTYDGINFDNVKSTGDKGTNLSIENIPEAALTTSISNEGDSVEIIIKNPSTNISEIKILKWVLNKGGARIRKNPIYTTFDNLTSDIESDYRKLSRNSSEIVINDYGVIDGHIYEYYAECKLKNGEIKQLNSTSVIKFESRSNIVNVELESISSKNGNSDVEIILNINKVQTEIDKVLKSVFGDVFELFSDDLKLVKDIQNFSYSILVNRLDIETGQNFQLGSFPVDNSENNKIVKCTITDYDVPKSEKLIYTITPRIALTSDIVSQTKELISNIGKKQGNNKINFSYASIRQKAKNNKFKKISTTGSKYNTFENLKRGLTTNDSYYLKEFNLDFFGNRSPGDILNIAYSPVTAKEIRSTTSGKNVNIELTRIKEIKYISKSKNESKDNIADMNISSTRLFDLQFKTTSNALNIDFYAIFISENNNVYLDGALHIDERTGENSSHRYLIEHSGSLGRINYYALPVLKDGTVLPPVLIGSNILE